MVHVPPQAFVLVIILFNALLWLYEMSGTRIVFLSTRHIALALNVCMNIYKL